MLTIADGLNVGAVVGLEVGMLVGEKVGFYYENI